MGAEISAQWTQAKGFGNVISSLIRQAWNSPCLSK